MFSIRRPSYQPPLEAFGSGYEAVFAQYQAMTAAETKPSLSKMITTRLRLPDDTELFDFMHPVEAAGKVFVFIISDNKPVTLEDEAHLFPSDQLITQLRMLRGK